MLNEYDLSIIQSVNDVKRDRSLAGRQAVGCGEHPQGVVKRDTLFGGQSRGELLVQGACGCGATGNKFVFVACSRYSACQGFKSLVVLLAQ